MSFYDIYQWLCFTRTGMFVLCIACFIIFLAVAFLLELRTRKRFYNHEKKSKKSVATKAGEALGKASEATVSFREKIESGEGFVGDGGIFGSDDDDEDEDDEDGLGSLFSGIRKDLEEWDPDEDEEDKEE